MNIMTKFGKNWEEHDPKQNKCCESRLHESDGKTATSVTGPTAPTPERPYGRPQNVLTSSLVSFTPSSSHKAKTSSGKMQKKGKKVGNYKCPVETEREVRKMSERWVTAQEHFSTECGSINASLTFSPCHPAIEGRWTAVSLGHHH